MVSVETNPRYWCDAEESLNLLNFVIT